MFHARSVGRVSKNKLLLSSSSSSSLGRRSTSTASLSLSKELPGVPRPSDFEPVAPVGKTATLSTGTKVATLFSKSPIATLGFFVNAGSRHEIQADLLGAAFYLRQMGYKGTFTRSSLRVVRDPELIGATYAVGSGREHLLFSSQVLSDNVEPAFNQTFDALKPGLEEYEVKDVKEVTYRVIEEIEANTPDLALEIAHQEAFRNVGLGNSAYTPRYRVPAIKRSTLGAFASTWYKPQNITVVAVGGVNHDEFVELAEKQFSRNVNSFPKGDVPTLPKSEYFGGDVRLANGGDTHVVLGFKGVGYNDPKLPALGVLQFLIGSSASPSGKPSGQASPLGSATVENPFILQASTFNFNYSDAGLFGVKAVVQPGHTGTAVQKLTAALKKAFSSISAAQLERAKSQFKAHALFTTQSRFPLLEFVYQRAQSHSLVAPTDFYKAVDSVSVQNVQALVKEVLASNPTLVVIGDVQNVPTTQWIKSNL